MASNKQHRDTYHFVPRWPAPERDSAVQRPNMYSAFISEKSRYLIVATRLRAGSPFYGRVNRYFERRTRLIPLRDIAIISTSRLIQLTLNYLHPREPMRNERSSIHLILTTNPVRRRKSA